MFRSNITIEEKELEQVLRNLKRFEYKFQSKAARPAIRSALKLARASARQKMMSIVGGRMGGLMAKSLKLKVPKKRKRYVIRNMLTMQVQDDFIHMTGRIPGRITSIRYFIPAAIEYGHAAPYDGVLAMGSGKKTAKPMHPFTKAWEESRIPMITEVVRKIRSKVDSNELG